MKISLKTKVTDETVEDLCRALSQMVDGLLNHPSNAPLSSAASDGEFSMEYSYDPATGRGIGILACRPAPPDVMFHVLDQSDQPYGSVRKCCNRCGIMIGTGMWAKSTVDEWSKLPRGNRCSP